jgi:hypothetical protein
MHVVENQNSHHDALILTDATSQIGYQHPSPGKPDNGISAFQEILLFSSIEHNNMFIIYITPATSFGLFCRQYTTLHKVKIKLSRYRPGQALGVPEFLDNRHMKVVRLSALSTGHLYPQEEFLVLVSVRG